MNDIARHQAMKTSSGQTPAPGASPTHPRLTFTQAVIEAIRHEMRADDSVLYLGQDVGVFGGVMQGTQSLYDEFGPGRILETPISESAMAGMGVGASLFGSRPIVEISFGEFLPSAMNQLINQAPNIHYMTGGVQSVPLVIRTRAGHGPYGGHPQDYSVWFCHVPGLKVVMPATPSDAYQLMRTAIRDPNPVLFVEPMSLSHGRRESVDLSALDTLIGKARVARQGQDLTLVAYGSQVPPALKAAEQAAADGVDAEVIDIRSLMPWDEDTVLASVRKTGALLTAHEAWTHFGHGAEVITRAVTALQAEGRTIRIGRVGAKPVPIPSGPLRQWALPNTEQIHAAILECAPAAMRQTTVDKP